MVWIAILATACAGADSANGSLPSASGDGGADADQEPPSGTGTEPKPVPEVPSTDLPRVCGGAQGNGGGITTIEGRIYPAIKYRLTLGVQLDPNPSEPGYLKISGAVVNGARTLSGLAGAGGLGKMSRAVFIGGALPITMTSQLGMSKFTDAVYSLTVGQAAYPKPTVAFGGAQHVVKTLGFTGGLSVLPNADRSRPYVHQIGVVAGVSYLMGVHFDAQCKADALLAMDVDLFSLKNDPKRKAVEAFLVANLAQFKLAVVQTGPENPAIAPVLRASSCSPADLGACEELKESLLQFHRAAVAAPLTESQVTQLGTQDNVGPFIIGSVSYKPLP